jgi:hypothetical protein
MARNLIERADAQDPERQHQVEAFVEKQWKEGDVAQEN